MRQSTDSHRSEAEAAAEQRSTETGAAAVKHSAGPEETTVKHSAGTEAAAGQHGADPMEKKQNSRLFRKWMFLFLACLLVLCFYFILADLSTAPRFVYSQF
ncbi:MAG: hypothetical protein IJ123_08700 [Blautia sp.]|nr:hypothetical protein [Blautia sp.]